MVFSPFVTNPRLVRKLIEFIRAEADRETEKIKKAVKAYTDYLEEGYLSPTHFLGYKNWAYFDMIKDGHTDTTNNVSETLNRKWNNCLQVGYKSFNKAGAAIYKQKFDFLEEYVEKVVNDRMRRRPPVLQRKMDARYEHVLKFDRKTNDQQIHNYRDWLGELSDLL